MVTGELRNKIDALWDAFAAGGLVNPLEVIEQITYLIFIHDLDVSDTMREKESIMLGLPFQSIFAGQVSVGDREVEGRTLKWSVFHDFPAQKTAHRRHEYDDARGGGRILLSSTGTVCRNKIRTQISIP